MNLSENLQALRKEHKLSQEEFAEKLGVSRQAISKWETGETSPETDKIIMICDIFNCSMDTLIKGKIANNHNNGKKIYDEFMKKFSLGISIGVFLILVGTTIFLTILSIAPKKTSLEQYTIIGIAILLIFVIIAVPIFIILGIQMDNISRKYKDLKDI